MKFRKNIQHKINQNVAVGGTVMNLNEMPLTQKANYGTEPVNNTMIGFNTNFSTEIPLGMTYLSLDVFFCRSFCQKFYLQRRAKVQSLNLYPIQYYILTG